MISPSGEVYSKYSIGPRTDPCGIPQRKSLEIDFTPSITTLLLAKCSKSRLELCKLRFFHLRLRQKNSSSSRKFYACLQIWKLLQFKVETPSLFLAQTFRKKLCSIVMSGKNLHQSVSHSVNSGGCTI